MKWKRKRYSPSREWHNAGIRMMREWTIGIFEGSRGVEYHEYLSTACWHKLGKDECRKECKFCSSPCVCECHKGVSEACDVVTGNDIHIPGIAGDRDDSGGL